MAESESFAPSEGPPETKKRKVETEVKETEVKPPPKQYKEIRKLLKSLNNQASKSEKDSAKICSLLSQLKQLCSEPVPKDELSPAAMLIQMHLKNAFFSSRTIKDGDNIKTFLNGLEDGSEGRSDKNNIYVFYANQATPLWYRWCDKEQKWEWTPERQLWMPCSTTVVTDGLWEGETPAPENVEIIHYLDTVQPVTTEEGYLSDQFNVATLLSGLATVNGVKQSAVAIATVLRDQEIPTQDEAKVLRDFKAAMTTLIDSE